MSRLALRRWVPGFTLIEIGLVIAILVIVVSIVFPNFRKMIISGNERDVMEAMRAVVLANQDYQAANPRQLPATISVLTAADPPYLDPQFNDIDSGDSWKGYTWDYAVADPRTLAIGNRTYSIEDSFTLTADPTTRGLTGQRGFFVNQTGVIRFDQTGTADVDSQSVDLRAP